MARDMERTVSIKLHNLHCELRNRDQSRVWQTPTSGHEVVVNTAPRESPKHPDPGWQGQRTRQTLQRKT